MSVENNPYVPPAATVFDVARTGFNSQEVFHPQGQHRSAGHGWTWITEAWQIFRQQPFMWWLALFLCFVVMVVAALIPFDNLVYLWAVLPSQTNPVSSLAYPFLIAGLGACAASVRRDGRFSFDMVFDGFRKRPGSMLFAGLLYLLALKGAGVLVPLLLRPELLKLFTGASHSLQDPGHLWSLKGYVYCFLLLLVGSTAVFAPFLIHEHGLSAPQAMLASARGCLKNIPAAFVAVMCYVLLGIAASIPLGLGWLVLIPVAVLSYYTAYRDIFLER